MRANTQEYVSDNVSMVDESSIQSNVSLTPPQAKTETTQSDASCIIIEGTLVGS